MYRVLRKAAGAIRQRGRTLKTECSSAVSARRRFCCFCLTERRRLAVGDELGDDAPHFGRKERLLDDGPPALRDEVSQAGGKRIPGDEDDVAAAAGPALLDLFVQAAPVEVRHADVREDDVVVLGGEA